MSNTFRWDHNKTSSWHNRHAGPPDKTKQKGGGVLIIVIIYDNSAVEPYTSRGLVQQYHVGEKPTAVTVYN